MLAYIETLLHLNMFMYCHLITDIRCLLIPIPSHFCRDFRTAVLIKHFKAPHKNKFQINRHKMTSNQKVFY